MAEKEQEQAPAAAPAEEQKKETPPKIYCLKCHCEQEVQNAVLETTEFESKRKHVPMTRKTWKGQCSVCGRKVSRFVHA